MSAPFAALQARMNCSVVGRLANAEALVGDVAAPGIFERRALVLNGVETTAPTFLLQASDVAALQIREGTQLRVPLASQALWGAQSLWGSGLFKVRGLEPDGTGMTLLILEAP